MKKFLNGKLYGCIYGLVYFWLGSALICGLPVTLIMLFSEPTLRDPSLGVTIGFAVIVALVAGPWFAGVLIFLDSIRHIRPSPWQHFRDQYWDPFMKKLPGWRGW